MVGEGRPSTSLHYGNTRQLYIPRTTNHHPLMDRGGWVYIMTNRPNGTLYIGVTSNLARRVYEHREGLFEGFTKQHKLHCLVWYERFEDIRDAIGREKRMKTWFRAWKTRAILQMNPEWADLYETLA